MTGADAYSLTGADLGVARRAIAVALVLSVAADEVHPVRARLPSHTDMLRVLDVLGWAGPPESTVTIARHDRRVLLDAVYAMLSLACEETVRSADNALRQRPPTIEADGSVLLVAESLAGLARRLQGPRPNRPGTAVQPGHETAKYRDVFANRVFDIIVEPVRNQGGAIFGCVGLGIEVTESVERELRLQQLLRQLEFGQRIGRIGTWEFDVRAGTRVWSEEAFRLLGAEPGSIEPNFATFLSRVHPDDRDRMRDLHAEGSRTGATYELDYRIERPDGEVRHMHGVVAHEHDPDGTLVRVAGILKTSPCPARMPTTSSSDGRPSPAVGRKTEALAMHNLIGGQGPGSTILRDGCRHRR